MSKPKFTDEDDQLLAELGVDVTPKKVAQLTAREQRIIAGFEEIEQFFEKNGRLPVHGEDRDIFERLYAVRLDRIRASAECREVLTRHDKNNLLDKTAEPGDGVAKGMDDDSLLAELGVAVPDEQDITRLNHVKPRAEVRAAEEVARRIPCRDFTNFKPLFSTVQEELDFGIRQTVPFQSNAQINKGELFILGGQKVYVAEMGEEFIADYGRPDRRLRVIYDNETESNMLGRSLERALQKDPAGRRITDAVLGPLFSGIRETDDNASGVIYVLRSKSDHPLIRENQDVIHKIGVTLGDVEKRITNARRDPTFLLADVEVVATYELSNINRTKLENLIHKFFEPAKLEIEITDRFGNPVIPREWFLVPLFIIDEVVEKIKDGSIVNYNYSPESGTLSEISER